MVGISSGELTSALRRVGIGKDDVTQVAPVSSIQGNILDIYTLVERYMHSGCH